GAALLRPDEQLLRVRRPHDARDGAELEPQHVMDLARTNVDDFESSLAALERDPLPIRRPAEDWVDAPHERLARAALRRHEPQGPGGSEVCDSIAGGRPERGFAAPLQPPQVATVGGRGPDPLRSPGVVGVIAHEHDLRTVWREAPLAVFALLSA